MKRVFFYLFFCMFFSQSNLPAQDTYQLNGDAEQIDSTCFRLTAEINDQAGSMWFLEKIDLSNNFTLALDMKLGCIDANGADGIYFAIQPISTSLGSSGGGIGYEGIAPSIGIEFDNWQNDPSNDPFYDHIAIMYNGNIDHASTFNLDGPVQIDPNNMNVEDCAYHPVKIVWDAQSTTLSAYWECELRVSYTGDIVNDIFNGDPEVYWGFTSATGWAVNDHEICFSYTTILDKLEDRQVCIGESTELSVPDFFLDYNWFPADGLSATDMPSVNASPETTTIYTVTFKDECDELLSDTLTVFVTDVQADLGGDTTVCEGDKLILDATVNADNAMYEWQDGSTDASLEVTEEGIYWVTLDVNGCISSDTVTVKECVSLDVSLLNFEGQSMPEGNLLTWTAISENNNAHFTLQRSLEGKVFFDIVKIDGKGNSQTQNIYRYLDEEALSRSYYYRLIQTDFNGASKTVGNVFINRFEKRGGETMFDIFPNPAQTDLLIQTQDPNTSSGMQSLSIYNMKGQLVLEKDLFTNTFSHRLSIESLSTGLYLLKIEGEAGRADFFKLVVR